MRGMDQRTGKFIDGYAHLSQSIRLILNTPLNSRVMLPEFGSEVIDLVDAPMTASNELRIYTATIEALQRWEPRIEVERVRVRGQNEFGVLELEIHGIVDAENIVINVPVGRSIPEVPITPPEVDGSVPQVPIDPSVPIVPTGDPRWTTFVFGNNDTFILGNDDTFGWDT